MEIERLVDVSAQEVLVDFVLNSKCRSNLRLTSLCLDSPVAFKVQTSSPNKFLVNPPSGVIPPFSHATIQIILKPQTHLPSSFPRSSSDRFLIKTARSSSSTETPTHDIKLKVAFVGPFLLRHAVSCGDVDAAKNIIKRQKTILSELTQIEAASILRVAAELDNFEDMVNLLLEAGLTIDECLKSDNNWKTKPATPNNGTDALYRETANGNCPMVEPLIELNKAISTHGNTYDKATVSSHVRDGLMKIVSMEEQGEQLIKAAREGEKDEIESMLERGVKVGGYRDQYGLTGLHAAAMKGKKEIATLLVEHDDGVKLECQDNEGHTPLHLAVEGGWIETVEMLLNYGANVNAQTYTGATPLYMAQTFGYTHILNLLLRNGASYPSTSP